MSKLKEIIHQYVVEALQEILDEENTGDTTHYNVTKAGHRAIMKSGLHEHPGVDYDPDNNKLSVTHYGGSRDETIRNGIVANHEKAGHLIKVNTVPAPKNRALPMPMRSEEVEQISEARKLLKTYNSPIAGIGAKVYHNPETGEHQVDFYKNGENLGEGPRYYTDDREDAHATAQTEIKHMEKIETALQKMRDNLAKRAPQTDKYDD
jgi:hypothetical protein